MNKENCALKLVDEIILYYDARSKKHQRHYIVKKLRLNLKSATSQPCAESRFLLSQIVRQPVAVVCGCPVVF